MTRIISTFSTLFLLFSVFSLRAQAADCEEPFVYFYGEGADYDARTLLSQDTFLYLGGQKDNAAFISKMTTNGELIWTQEMTPYSSLPNAIVDLKLASDGTLIGCGQAREGSNIESFAFKIDPVDGSPVWTQTYEDPNTDYFAATDIFETTSNGSTYILLGTAFNNTATNTGCDAAFYSVDRNNGNIASERIHYHLGSCDGIESTVYSNGSFFTTGSYNFANSGFNRMRSAVSSFNTTGTPLWSRLYLVDINQDARLYSDDIALDGSNRLVVLARGDDNGVAAENADIFLYTIDRNIGGLVLARKYTFPENVISQEITVVENGYLIVAAAPDTDRTYLLRVNGVGTPIWGKRLDGIITNGVGDELVVNDNLAYLAGQYIGATNNYAALLRFDVASGELPEDCIPSVDFMPVMSSIPSAYDGFNSLSTYNTAVSEAGSFDLAASSLAELPTSCGPACGPEICDNGIDDDGNGLADCEDPACDCEEDCFGSSFVTVIGREETQEVGETLMRLTNGNLLLSAHRSGTLLLVETTASGNVVDQRSFSYGNEGMLITDLHYDSDGMLIGAGREGGINTASGFAFRYDYDNNQILWWQKIETGIFGQSIIEPVAGGDFVLIGNHSISAPAPGSGEDISWLSLDRNTGLPNGNIDANFSLGSGSETFFKSIIYNGRIYHTGRYALNSDAGSFRNGVSAFTLDGQEIWTKLYHVSTTGNARLYGKDIVVDDDHLINLYAGDDDGISTVDTEFFLSKLTLDGEVVWLQKYDLPDFGGEYAEAVVVLEDGYLILGQDRSVNGQAVFLMKTDKNGDVIWTNSFTSTETLFLADFGKNIIVPSSSGFAFAATRFGVSSSGFSDAMIIKANLAGKVNSDCLTTTPLDVNQSGIDNPVVTDRSFFSYDGAIALTSIDPDRSLLALSERFYCSDGCEEICDNGIDDDGNGLADCEDPSCGCIEICDNGIDDDGNGLADCEDPACDCESDCDSSSFALYIGTESENEEGDVLLALPNGNVLVGGGGESAIQLLEITPTGVIVSDRKVNTNGRSYITDLDFDSDGMIIGCGRTFSASNVQSAMVFRYDYDNDNFLWYQTTAGGQGAYSVLEPVAGGDITLVGLQFNSPFPGGGDDTSWQSFDRNTGMPTTTISKNIALSGPESFYQSIVHENKIYHVGRIGFSNNPADFRAVVARYSTSGDQEWVRSLHLPNSVTARLYAYDIVVEDNFIYAFGSGDDDGTSLTNSQLFLYKLTLDGTLVWTKKYDIAGLTNEWAHSILVVDDGILLYGDEEGGDSDIFLLKVNKEGEFQWGKRYLTDGQERLNGIVNQQIIEAGNSLYFVAISNELSTNGSEDILLIHSDLNGVIADDCFSYEEIQVTETTISNASAFSMSLTEYNNTFDFSSEDANMLAGDNTLLSSCTILCEEICDNGIDDDGDGLIDCEDPDVADDCCCYEAPVLNLGTEGSICAGGELEIDAGPGFETYSWSDGSGGQTLTVSNSGFYSVTVTDICQVQQIDTFSVSVLPAFSSTQSITICEGETADIFGNPESEPGQYNMTFTATNGCDSTHTVTLSVLESFMTNENQTICEGSSTEIFGQTVTEVGDYSMTFTGSNGCDSTHTVSVTVLEVLATSENQTICEGSSTEIFGQTVTEAGDYSMTFTGSNGCDSTHTVSVTVLEVLATSEDQSICAGSSTEIFGQTVTEAGDYSMTFTGSNGCDSTHTVSVTVLEVLATSEDQSICAGSSTEIFGQTVTEAGDYSMTFTASNGCDSMHTVSVTVLENIATSESFENLCAASSIEVFGEIITESGVFEQTYTAANGCDSTHTVAVSFLPPNVTMEEITICPDESIDIFGETVTEEGVYTGNFTGIDGCDSTHVITLISETFSSFANIYPPCPGDPMLGWLVYIRTTGNGGPYTVTYNGQLAYSNTIGGLQPGDHTAQVTSANGCEYTVDFTIRDYSQPWSPLVADVPTNNEPYGGSIQMEVADDLGPITFSIDGVNYYEKPVFEGLSKGEYTLYVDYGGYCSFCTPVTVAAPEEDHSTTIAETVNKDEFTAIPTATAAGQRILQLYPNPARQTFSLRGAENLNLKTVRLLTLTGSPLKSWMAAEAGTVLSLPGDLPDGVYLIQTITIDGTTEYQKLVVAK